MNSKNLIPIRTHAHLINTCSSKFGAALGLKTPLEAENSLVLCAYHYLLQTLTI